MEQDRRILIFPADILARRSVERPIVWRDGGSEAVGDRAVGAADQRVIVARLYPVSEFAGAAGKRRVIHAVVGYGVDRSILASVIRRRRLARLRIAKVEVVLAAGRGGELRGAVAVVHLVTGDSDQIGQCSRGAQQGS